MSLCKIAAVPAVHLHCFVVVVLHIVSNKIENNKASFAKRRMKTNRFMNTRKDLVVATGVLLLMHEFVSMKPHPARHTGLSAWTILNDLRCLHSVDIPILILSSVWKNTSISQRLSTVAPWLKAFTQVSFFFVLSRNHEILTKSWSYDNKMNCPIFFIQ